MTNSKNNKKDPKNGIKKIAEFNFNFDLKTIFIIFFVVARGNRKEDCCSNSNEYEILFHKTFGV